MLQIDAFKVGGCCGEPFVDHASGALENRPRRDRIPRDMRPGATLVVWRRDRPGRSLLPLIEVVTDLGVATTGRPATEFMLAGGYGRRRPCGERTHDRTVPVGPVCQRDGGCRLRCDCGMQQTTTARWRRRGVVLVLVGLTGPAASACTSSRPDSARDSHLGAASSPVSSSTVSSSPATHRPGAPSTATALPRGGRTLLPRYRIVAYYGAPFAAGLGVLGHGSPEQEADAIEQRAVGYAPFGRPVQPAMELIATVAQGSPGPDGNYSAAVSHADVRRYLAVARAHRMVLVLDFQPGRGDFLPQVQQFADVIADPWVGVALDPEWKVGPGRVPAQVVGSSSAESINAVSGWLAGMVRGRRLPQKLFVVHQFTLSMLPDRGNIRRHPELATVLHADGHGTVPVKEQVYADLAFPRSFGAGFKLFFDEDATLMSPAQVMALPRRPDLITYQ